MTTTSADHLPERRASWRWRLAVAVAAAVAVIGSTLTASLPAHADPTWPVLACAWSASSLAIGFIPVVGPLKPALKRLGAIARRPLPRNAKDAATAAEQQAFAQLGYVSPDIVGQLHGAARDVLATSCR